MPSPSDSDPVLPSLNLDFLGQRIEGQTNPGKRRQSANAGDVIGERYIVDGQIGRGSMGRVLKVRHQVLDKAFALKLPKIRAGHETIERERFYREACLASWLNHDNICSVVDFGDDPQFGLFMVMELLEGQALKDKLESDGRLSARSAADIMLQIAEALRYVHSQGVVHGDIKPDNIMLIRTSDRSRMVKLLDFGLARPQADDGDGSVFGTPDYLAPERIRSEPASVASDIYALGILFYELLVGTPPFQGTATEVLEHHLRSEVPAPSTMISDELDERANLIIARATAKDPKHRHKGAAAFLYELKAFCNMHGIDLRRRSAGRSTLVRTAEAQVAKAGAEVFEQAPVPLAAVAKDGTIRSANRAFLTFLGMRQGVGDMRLPQTKLMKVYPDLVTDLAKVASTGTSVKRTLKVSAGGDRYVHVAVLMTAPAPEDCSASAEVHIALHPILIGER